MVGEGAEAGEEGGVGRGAGDGEEGGEGEGEEVEGDAEARVGWGVVGGGAGGVGS